MNQIQSSQGGVPAAILAGGASRRMGDGDKAVSLLAGKRLIDHVVARLAPQVSSIILVGPNSFGTALPTATDDPKLRGPAAGVFGAANAFAQAPNPPLGFVTAPVDAPFLPLDLVARLTEDPASCAVAADEDGIQPTFAYWTLTRLTAVAGILGDAPALARLADLTGARTVHWPKGPHFMNVNTPEDLRAAERFAADYP
ncbi:MAG: molybdenum cofactor guanylyltransferase [Devosiaceae bacterium]|nr:molybdenum cofactor guanylyltransferase [Devosiaceae bacterium MH13]